MKKPILSLTQKDFTWQFYVGRGKGGQKKNKTANCCRCIHEASGVMATSEDGRSQRHNKELAFAKVVKNPVFKRWLNLECARILGHEAEIEEAVRRSLQPHNIKTEVKENGKWVQTNI